MWSQSETGRKCYMDDVVVCMVRRPVMVYNMEIVATETSNERHRNYVATTVPAQLLATSDPHSLLFRYSFITLMPPYHQPSFVFFCQTSRRCSTVMRGTIVCFPANDFLCRHSIFSRQPTLTIVKPYTTSKNHPFD